MNILERLRLRFRPPRMDDRSFGPLVFMYIPNDPQSSYWEGEWLFPPTGTRVSISLPGGIEGPAAESRDFMLSRAREFDRIMELARPKLAEVVRSYLSRPLSDDIWSDLELAGFDVEDPKAFPIEWSVSFETIGDRWLGIIVPFAGSEPQDAVVDT